MRRFIPYASTAIMLLAAGCGGFTTLGDGAGTGGTANAAGMGMGDNGGDGTTGGTGGSGATGGTMGTTGGSGGTTGMTGGTTGMTGGTTGMTGGTSGTGAKGGTGATGGTGMTECTTAKDCATPAICQMCADGSAACATSDCASGKCVTSFPACPAPECMSDAECPVSKVACQQCSDGSMACPWAHCTGGKCTSGIDTCNNTAPCKGKSCGDLCSTCPAGALCNNPAQYCDESLNCQANQPMCTAPQCMQDADCATDVCGQCAGSTGCASQVCIDSKCQFSCPPPPMDPCGGCPTNELCVEQMGGPATSTTIQYHCAKAPPCPVAVDASQCLCVQGEGTCKQAATDSGNYCLCDNGIR